MSGSSRMYISVKTIKTGMIENTAGYDIHYLISEGEDEKATQLKLEVKGYILKELEKNPKKVYLTEEYQADKPVGPWKKNMWELQISPHDKTDFKDKTIFSFERNEPVHQLMLRVAAFTKQRIQDLELKGSLLIHANTWPEYSNMAFERDLHYKHQWLVCGEAIEFKDIWREYLAIDSFVKQAIKEKGGAWENSAEQQAEIIKNLQEQFRSDPLHGGEVEIARKTKNIFKGQANLLLMQASSKPQP